MLLAMPTAELLNEVLQYCAIGCDSHTFYPNLIGQVPWDGDITDLLILGIEPDPAARESV